MRFYPCIEVLSRTKLFLLQMLHEIKPTLAILPKIRASRAYVPTNVRLMLAICKGL